MAKTIACIHSESYVMYTFGSVLPEGPLHESRDSLCGRRKEQAGRGESRLVHGESYGEGSSHDPEGRLSNAKDFIPDMDDDGAQSENDEMKDEAHI